MLGLHLRFLLERYQWWFGNRQLQRNSDYWLTGRLCFKEIFCKFLTFGYHLHDFLLLGVNLLSREGYSWTGDRMSWLNLKSLLLNPISSGTDWHGNDLWKRELIHWIGGDSCISVLVSRF